MIKKIIGLENRKATFLIKEGVMIIVAILIGFLLFVGVSKVWGNISENEASESAKDVADVLEAKINAFLESDEKSINTTIQGVNSENIWYLTGWDRTKTERPSKCFLNNCICISPEGTSDSCQEKGFHRVINVDKLVVISYYFYISEGYDQCEALPLAPLHSNLIELHLTKINDGLMVEYIVDKPENYDPRITNYDGCIGAAQIKG